VLDALSDKWIISLAAPDVAYVVNGGAPPTKSMIASVYRALRTLEAAGKVVCLKGKWVLASRRKEAERARGKMHGRKGAKSTVQYKKQQSLELIAKILGMLGSSHDGEVLAAARRAEAKRLELGLSWKAIVCGQGNAD